MRCQACCLGRRMAKAGSAGASRQLGPCYCPGYVLRACPVPGACSDAHVAIKRWAEVSMARRAGRVAQALAGAMEELAGEWALMVTQLEHQMLTGNLTMQARPHAAPDHACACPHACNDA